MKIFLKIGGRGLKDKKKEEEAIEELIKNLEYEKYQIQLDLNKIEYLISKYKKALKKKAKKQDVAKKFLEFLEEKQSYYTEDPYDECYLGPEDFFGD